ncbi:MAG: 23S rRNA (guanosine(2251)-2'-O)-methyltransferase RlmB [Gammaproteobacteria bacterium]|nr:23S rRNA (guanosine(2251)-2'-O)-methyltransferase RlmB [Gammaproteobacteria bacterium]
MAAKDDLIYGLHAVTKAIELNPDSLDMIWIDQKRHDNRLTKLIELAKKKSVNYQLVSVRDIESRVSGVTHQGIVASCYPAVVYTEADLMRVIESVEGHPFLLVLDGVQDPHNLGACLRSADAAGVQAVIVPKDKSASLTGAVRKVASGAAERIPFIQVTNLARTLSQLKDKGIWLVGTAGNAEKSIYDIDLKGPLAIVLGGEGKGMRRLTEEHCDFLASIPMAGVVESLNVSVATGVCLFEAVRQRQRASA